MITREDLIEQSVTEYVKAAIFTERGYSADQVEIRESFPYRREESLERNIVAIGFNFDDDGQQAELGSDLMERQYTIEFWIFGLTNTYARNLANVLKFALGKDQFIPLLNIEDPAMPEIDTLEVDGVTAERQPIADPEPWQEFVWTTTVKVTDSYFASLV